LHVTEVISARSVAHVLSNVRRHCGLLSLPELDDLAANSENGLYLLLEGNRSQWPQSPFARFKELRARPDLVFGCRACSRNVIVLRSLSLLIPFMICGLLCAVAVPWPMG